jgi:hypothetical protein
MRDGGWAWLIVLLGAIAAVLYLNRGQVALWQLQAVANAGSNQVGTNTTWSDWPLALADQGLNSYQTIAPIPLAPDPFANGNLPSFDPVLTNG